MIRYVILYSIVIAGICCSPKPNTYTFATQNEIRAYKLENVDTLVDIGCGDGGHDRQIARQYPNLYLVLEDFAVDLQGHNIPKRLNQRFTSINHRYRFVAGSEDSIPLPSGAHKRVLCRRTFHEFSNRQKMVSELVRILADGGILTVIESISEPVL